MYEKLPAYWRGLLEGSLHAPLVGIHRYFIARC